MIQPWLVELQSMQKGHWVGMMIDKRGSAQELKFTYLDTDREEGEVSSKVREGAMRVKEALGVDVHYEEKQIENQKYNDCGVQLIEELLSSISGVTRAISQEEAHYIQHIAYENYIIKNKEIGWYDPIKKSLETSIKDEYDSLKSIYSTQRIISKVLRIENSFKNKNVISDIWKSIKNKVDDIYEWSSELFLGSASKLSYSKEEYKKIQGIVDKYGIKIEIKDEVDLHQAYKNLHQAYKKIALKNTSR